MYNLFPEGEDKIIQADTEAYICRYIEKHFPDTAFREGALLVIHLSCL